MIVEAAHPSRPDRLQLTRRHVEAIVAAREAAARAEVLAEVAALHRPWRIYDECGHDHTDEDYEAGRCIEVSEIGYVCDDGLMYVICRECCCDYDGFNYWQTESCANGHNLDHTKIVGPSLCPTSAILARHAAGGEG